MTSTFDPRRGRAAACGTALAVLLALGGCSRPAEEASQSTAGAEAPAAGDTSARQPRRQRTKPVFFKVGFPTEQEGTFVLRLVDPGTIQAARNAVRDPDNHPHHVMGTLVKKDARFNPGWSYHLLPRSVEFFDQATEACDATPQYVEEHLEEACGAFLPDCRWCPWTSKVLAEVPPPAAPAAP